jgi:hypothetical protein
MISAVRTNWSVWPMTRFRSGQILRFPKSVVPNFFVTASRTQ